ncbi:hypothetical protein cyc_08196 [Cyclospora cayetanensis]|uniref:Tyrosine specific protein phosphatases domain-containing protein n=1 Tax=Cyclospora cayetanensis TaxID=88456 RepID=A0A1D3CZY1_9EIME|nr:hypothetical protein cyc_08196 [Cyclospora cayetanensis]
MTEESASVPSAPGAEAAPSADKKKRKVSKTATKKRSSSSTKAKSTKGKTSSSKSKESRSAQDKADKPERSETAEVPAEDEQQQNDSTKNFEAAAESHMVSSEPSAGTAVQELEREACEEEGEPLLPMDEDGKQPEAPVEYQESRENAHEDGEKEKVNEEALKEAQAEKKAPLNAKPGEAGAAGPRHPSVKRQHMPWSSSPLLECIPRTSLNGVCGGPWRSSAYCSWLHDTVGCTCRRVAGGPLPEKWGAFSDFLAAIDIRDTADKKSRGELDLVGTNNADEEKAAKEAFGEAEKDPQQQEEYASPNPLMVEKLLLLPCKTFLSTAFAPQLLHCRPFSPIGLQEQFDGAQRRRAGLSRRFARLAAGAAHTKPTAAEDKREDQQEKSSAEKDQQQEQPEQSLPARRPPTCGSECLIDEGRMRILSVINLCLTERHYEPQLLRRDCLPVFWHKSQGGGEVPTPESLLNYFKLLSLLTMQGIRVAEHWAAAADCAVCNSGTGAATPQKGNSREEASKEVTPCTCSWRFTVVTHCTHGVNRTGYMVCALLMALLGLSAAEAQGVFKAARGHAIPREEIIAALQQLEKEGVSEAMRAALAAPELHPVYAENAAADGVELQKGSCFVRVATAAAPTETGRTIPISGGFKKSLTSYRELERQRLIRAKQASQNREQREQKQQQQQESKDAAVKEEATGEAEGGNICEAKGESSDVKVEEAPGAVTEQTAAGAAEDAKEVFLTEDEMKQLPVVPSEVPNNGVVLFGPLSNALLAPEELLLYLLDLHPNLRMCDYRVLASSNVNQHLGYPATNKKTGFRRRRRVGVPNRTSGPKAEDEGEPVQQPPEQAEEQAPQQDAVAPQPMEKPLAYHYILYVQAADPFSFETLVASELVSLRKQPLQAFTLDFLPYILARGKELDAVALNWSVQHPPRPKRGPPPLPLPFGAPFPPPGFGGPIPPPHPWMGPGGFRKRGSVDVDVIPPFMRGNGRFGGPAADCGGKPVAPPPPPFFGGGGQWREPPPPPPPSKNAGAWKGPEPQVIPPHFPVPGVPEFRPGYPQDGPRQFDERSKDPGARASRQGPPRDFYDAVRQQTPTPSAGGSWRAHNPQGWTPCVQGALAGGHAFQMPKDNAEGGTWGTNNWESCRPQGASDGWNQGPPGPECADPEESGEALCVTTPLELLSRSGAALIDLWGPLDVRLLDVLVAAISKLEAQFGAL